MNNLVSRVEVSEENLKEVSEKIKKMYSEISSRDYRTKGEIYKSIPTVLNDIEQVRITREEAEFNLSLASAFSTWCTFFDKTIKGTFEDSLAVLLIKLLEISATYCVEPVVMKEIRDSVAITYQSEYNISLNEHPINLSVILAKLVITLKKMDYKEESICTTLSTIYGIADYYKIDINWFMEKRLEYDGIMNYLTKKVSSNERK